jgi:hypothetical protein
MMSASYATFSRSDRGCVRPGHLIASTPFESPVLPSRCSFPESLGTGRLGRPAKRYGSFSGRGLLVPIVHCMYARRTTIGVAFVALLAAGCGASRHDHRLGDRNPVSVAAVVRAFDREGVHLLRLTAKSPALGVVVTTRDATGRMQTTESFGRFPGPGPAHLAWFEAWDLHAPKTPSVLDVRVYRTADIAKRAARILHPAMGNCWSHNNVLLCAYFVFPSGRPWQRRALRTLNHF